MTKSLWVYYRGYDSKEDDKIRKLVGRDYNGSGYCLIGDERDLSFTIPEEEVDEVAEKLEAAGYKIWKS